MRQLPRDIHPDAAQNWINNQSKLEKVLRERLVPSEWRMLLAACKQKAVSQYFSEHAFPLEAPDTREVEEYCFKEEVAYHLAKDRFAKMNYEVVKMRRAMEYVIDHPLAQFEHPLVVLGVEWRHRGGASVAVFDKTGIILHKVYSTILWLTHCEYLYEKFPADYHFLVYKRAPDKEILF